MGYSDLNAPTQVGGSMKNQLAKIKIVVLHCPYTSWKDKRTKDIFTKMIELKFSGYQHKHFYGTLPVDETDYIADHPLICFEDDNGELTPISGSKVITHSTCNFFNVGFAMKTCLEKNQKSLHLEILNGILDNAKHSNKSVAYHGGYTILPEVRGEEKFLNTLRELFIATSILYFQHNHINELLGIGVPKYKTDDFFYKWGYYRCTRNYEELNPFPLYFLGGIDGVMMHLNKFSKDALLLAEKYHYLWENRLVIGSPVVLQREKLKEAA